MDRPAAARTIVWNSLVDRSLEICWVHAEGDRWTFIGAATLVEGDRPFAIDYEIRLDRRSFATEIDARVRSRMRHERRIVIEGRPGQSWELAGGDSGTREALGAGTCIDLGWTPLTNTFSIWSLDLAVGATAEITNAWVPFPDVTLRSSAQRYTRLSNHRYRYEQPAIDFRADLEVDEDGFVRRYGDIWESVTVTADIVR